MSSQPFIAAEHQASTLHLPPGKWPTVLDCLSEHFNAISREQWLDRIARGRVLDADGALRTDGIGQTFRGLAERLLAV